MSSEPLWDRRSVLFLLATAITDAACATISRRSFPFHNPDAWEEQIPFRPQEHRVSEADLAEFKRTLEAQDYASLLVQNWKSKHFLEGRKNGTISPLSANHEFHVDGHVYRLWVDESAKPDFERLGARYDEFLALIHSSWDTSLHTHRLLRGPMREFEYVFSHFPTQTMHYTNTGSHCIYHNTRSTLLRFLDPRRSTAGIPVSLRHELYHVDNYVTDRFHRSHDRPGQLHTPRSNFMKEITAIIWEATSQFYVEFPDVPLSTKSFFDGAKADVEFLKTQNLPFPHSRNLWRYFDEGLLPGQDPSETKTSGVARRAFGYYTAGFATRSCDVRYRREPQKAREMLLFYNQALLHSYAPDISDFNALNVRFGILQPQPFDGDHAGMGILTYASVMGALKHLQDTGKFYRLPKKV